VFCSRGSTPLYQHELDPEALAKAKLTLTDAEPDEPMPDGSVKSEDRQKVRTDVEALTEKLMSRACNATWQMGNCRREELAPDGSQLCEQFGWLGEDLSAHLRPIFLITDGYHRTIPINPNAMGYICIPTHKFREAENGGAQRCEMLILRAAVTA